MQANHFSLNRSLSFCRSVYQHSRPYWYAAVLRNPVQPFDAAVEDGNVVVYHGSEREPEDRQLLVERRTLSAELDSVGFHRAVNAHVGLILRSAGFLRIRRSGKNEYISPDKHFVPLMGGEQSSSSPRVLARAHLRWTWDVEQHHGRIRAFGNNEKKVSFGTRAAAW